MQKNNLAIILSGGTGTRFDISKPKQFYKFNKSKVPKLPRLKSISNFHLSQNNMLNQYYGSFLGIKKFI